MKVSNILSFLFSLAALIFSYLAWNQDTRLPVAHAVISEPKMAKTQPEISARHLSDALADVAEAVKPAVVSVFTERVYKQMVWSPFDGFFGDFFGDFMMEPRERQYRQTGLGSGVVIKKNGIIVTNNHVIDEASSIRVQFLDQKLLAAKIIGRDPKTDIAVLKVEADDLTVVALGNSEEMRVGEIVLAIGSPMSAGLAHTVTQGIVSAVGRSNVGLAEYEDFIQTDAAINPGNSGGALVNLDGELIGINTAIVSQSGGSQGIGFAVPINMAAAIAESLIESGRIVRSWLGLRYQNLTVDIAKALELNSIEGVLVADVAKDGPGFRAGLQRGDVVIEVNGEKVINSIYLKNRIALSKPGTEFKLKVVRGKLTKIVDITCEELPAERK